MIYISWWLNPHNNGNSDVYNILFFGEIYHIIMSYLLWITLWPMKRPLQPLPHTNTFPPTDIFITAANEPLSIIAETATAAKAQNYRNKKIYILNDGYVAKRK